MVESITELIPRKIPFVDAAQSPNAAHQPSKKPPDLYPLNQLKSIWHWKKPFSRLSGFQNSGATCYLNSVLQSLLAIPAVHNYLSSQEHSAVCAKKEAFCHLCYFEKIAQQSHEAKTIFPKQFVANLRVLRKEFRPFEEQDAHEFLRCFLDRLADNSVDAVKGGGSGDHRNTKKQPTETSFFNRTFEGNLCSVITCDLCGSVSETKESFFDLSLSINKVKSVDQALDFYFKDQTFSDANNLYFCDRCKKKTTAKRRFSVTNPPNVLTLHLKRFTSELGLRFLSKNSRSLPFSADLNFSKFSKKTAFDSQNGAFSEKSADYSLCAVVVHVGSLLSSGHYLCYVKGPFGQWYLADDDKIEKVSLDRALRDQAYILVYKRNEVATTPETNATTAAKTEFRLAPKEPETKAINNCRASSKFGGDRSDDFSRRRRGGCRRKSGKFFRFKQRRSY